MPHSESPRKVVAFKDEPIVRYIEKPLVRKHRKGRNMTKASYEEISGSHVTDDMLEEAVQLFNANYGIWGEDPTNPRANPKQGE